MRRLAGRHAVLRVFVVWVVTAVTLFVLSALIPEIDIPGWGSAFAIAALIGLLNAVMWPLFIRFALPVTVLTLGVAALLLNGVIVWIASSIIDGFGVGVIWGTVVALVLTVVNTLVTSLLGIDDHDFYYRNVIRRAATRQGATSSDVPGVVFLEIDGLAHEVVVRAMRDGNMPTVARWLREGSHHLIGWETDWSSQTGACQAGLLHGNSDDWPAFRWWEKEHKRPIVTNHPRDAAELERRHSNGRGLLHEDGASRANILSGDAEHSLLTMSTVLRRDRPGRIGQDYFAYFANPYNVTRTVVFALADIAQELYYAAQQRRRDIRPRIKRTLSYALVRSWATVIQRDLQVAAIIGDLYAGRPVAYTTFLAYDEVAHHSGIERPDALSTLRRIDRQFARIEHAAKEAPRPYHLVVLSDHGQSQGATFLDRYGTSLEDLVREACAAESIHVDGGGSNEAAGYLGASLTEAGSADNVVGRSIRAATKGKRVDGAVQLGKRSREETAMLREAAQEDQLPELSVMASGCLGLISFPREPGRLTLERIEHLYPKLVPALRDHPGIGFMLVRSERHGAVAVGAHGTHYLDEERVEGEDPLAPFGPNAARHVRRADGYEHVADIMVNSTYYADMDEVAAFEELVGSHGGMGGSQSFPFVVVPAGWRLPEQAIVGPDYMHRQMRRWLADLGHEGYRDGAA
ncbi:MAG TPA: phage holin family protein [Rubrobacteraceae bacterium]|nr:phage holin family protein [Rubrobacteraceae bacterium]